MGSKIKIFLKDSKTLARWLLISGGIAVCLRIFVFASYMIPASSMESGILAGDYVIVNKLIIESRIYSNFNFLQGEKVKTRRFWGIRKIKRNDILVFNFPYPKSGKNTFRFQYVSYQTLYFYVRWKTGRTRCLFFENEFEKIRR